MNSIRLDEKNENVMSEEEFRYYDTLFRNNNGMVSPLENPFVQHLLFDPYMKEQRGNDFTTAAKNFISLLSNFYSNLEIKKKYNYLKIDDIRYLQYLLKTAVDLNLQKNDK